MIKMNILKLDAVVGFDSSICQQKLRWLRSFITISSNEQADPALIELDVNFRPDNLEISSVFILHDHTNFIIKMVKTGWECIEFHEPADGEMKYQAPQNGAKNHLKYLECFETFKSHMFCVREILIIFGWLDYRYLRHLSTGSGLRGVSLGTHLTCA